MPKSKLAIACNIVKAIFSRFLLCSCIFLTSWRSATVTSDNAGSIKNPMQDGSFNPTLLLPWLPCCGIILFIPDIILTLVVNRGQEFKWWSPAIAIFLGCNIPSIWAIEIDIHNRISHPNFTDWESESLSKLGSFTLPIYFTPPNWARLLEQSSFLVLIFAKWMLPKGMVSREKLSQLLLFFVGMASDILDLMDNLHDELVTISTFIVFAVLVCYTTSHFQFSFNYTAKRKYKMRWSSDETDISGFTKFKRRMHYVCCCCFETDMWVMFATIFGMDGLFLALRLYLFLGLKVVTFGNIFFAAKNAVMVAIDIYRVFAICVRMRKRNKGSEEKKEDICDIDESKVLEMNMTVESDGVLVATAHTLRRDYEGGNRFTKKKKTWELNAVMPQWVDNAKKTKKSIQAIVPGAELHLIYEIDMTFDRPDTAGDVDENQIFQSIKEITLKDAINPKIKKNKSFSSSNKIRPLEFNEDEEELQRL